MLSALIGNNNSTASPRWSLVSPQEVARIDVLYGPFSAAYPGNAIGAVVNITTRLPDRLEGEASIATSVQRFVQYGTSRVLPATSVGATFGDRIGPLAVFASFSHVTSNSQPLAYITATRAAAPGPGGSPTNGGYDDVNRSGAVIRVIGAGGFEHQVQDFAKLKLALDVSPGNSPDLCRRAVRERNALHRRILPSELDRPGLFRIAQYRRLSLYGRRQRVFQ